MGRRIFHEGKDFRIGNGACRLGCDKRDCGNEARRDGLLPALQVVGGEGALAMIRQRPLYPSLSKRRSEIATPKQSRRRGGRPARSTSGKCSGTAERFYRPARTGLPFARQICARFACLDARPTRYVDASSCE